MAGTSRRAAVFLDRDGTLNASDVVDGEPRPPAGPLDLVILPGVVEAVQRLRAAGYLLIVVTNQPDVARGTRSRAEVEAVNDRLHAHLLLDAIFVCYHDDADGCHCRKPLPGMLVEASERYAIDLRRSFMVGDRWKDVEAGRRAGCATILLRRPYSGDQARADFEAASLAEAADIILRVGKERCREDLR